MRLTLVLPQLVWPEPEDALALDKLPCPALAWLLAHGAASRAPAIPFENALAALFGLDASPPFGALRFLGESPAAGPVAAPAGNWLCADPVHLRFHHERIILADAGAFELSAEEAEALVAGLNREFADLGEFHVAQPRRWYLRLKADCDLAAQPLSAVAGRRIEGQLPNAGAGSRLRSWLNEVQMFLHLHPVNAARAASGHPAVNSLWLWGAGEMEAKIPAHREVFDSVWTDDPLARGLGRAAGIPVHAVPQNLDWLLAEAPGAGSQLVVLDHLLGPVLYEDAAGWREALLGLEETWFAPLKARLGRGVEGLTLVAPTAYGRLAWQLEAGARWKFWRKPKPLADLARELVAAP